jgi:hypothetical protein
VDETYVGILDPRKLGQEARHQSNTAQTLVAIAIEMLEPKGFGRIRLQRVRSTGRSRAAVYM